MNDIKIYNNFLDEDDCKAIIERLEYFCNTDKVKVRHGGSVVVQDLDDPIFQNFVDKYYQKSLEILQNKFVKYNGYLLAKYNEEVGMDTHIDSEPEEEVGILMYLNDNYDGGELTFTAPDGLENRIKPQKADMICFPSWWPHGVSKVTKGTRYFFTISLLK